MDNNKADKLKRLMEDYGKDDVCVAFSGGVDSSLLLVMACEAAKKTGKKVYAITMDTVLHPKADLAIAKKVLSGTQAEHHVITLNELTIPELQNNPVNRCYLCKKELFHRIQEFARQKNVSIIIEGTNEDDLHVYRPGIQAIRELGIKSPLARCEMTKADVRVLAGKYGIPVANRPSAPCLATRLPYGTKIDFDLLKRIEKAEERVKELVPGNVRIRVHGDILRLETDEQVMPMLLENREKVLSCLKEVGCPYITFDLEGFRSGSMDVHVEK